MKKLAFVMTVALTCSLLAGWCGVLPALASDAERPLIELSIGGQGIGVNEVQLGNVPQIEKIEQMFGIRLNVVPDLTDEKIAALIAANDLPDIFSSHKHDLGTILSGKMVHALDEYITPETAPNILKRGEPALQFSKEFYSDDSHSLYAIPSHIADGAPSFLIYPMMRWDYYQEIGTPEINTFDDFVDALIAVKEKHPTNASGEPYYGLPLSFAGRLWSYCVPFGFMIEGRQYRGDQFLDYDIVSDTYSGLISDENSSLWNAVRMMNKLHRNGLLDPEAFSMTDDTLVERRAADRYLSIALTWDRSQATAGAQSQGAQTEFVPMYAGKDSAFVATYSEPVGSVAYLWTISQKTNQDLIPRIVEFFDYCYTPDGCRDLYLGVEGSAWERDANGKAVRTAQYEADRVNSDLAAIYGGNKLGGMMGLASAYFDQESGQYIDMSINSEEAVNAYTDIEKEYCAKFGIKTLLDPMTNCRGYIHNSSATNVIPNATSDQRRAYSTMENYLITNLPNLILSATTPEELEAGRLAMIEELKGMGLEAFEGFWLDEVQKAQQIEKEILSQ